MKKCPKCSKKLNSVDDIVFDLNSHSFSVKGKRCSGCGEEIIDEQEGQKLINLAKNIGLWQAPLKLHRKLSRSARGTILRIPLDIEKELQLKGNEKIAISKIGEKKLMIEIE